MPRIVFVLMAAGFALLGRWLQLHPEKVFPVGMFVGEDSKGAKLARAEIAVVGIFAVLLGTGFASYTVLQLVTFGHWALNLVAGLIAAIAGVIAARHVRTEVKMRPPHHSTSPYGWWP